ncbi:biotin synthase [Mycobacterium haemophilum DSM 44634]|uniref:biotin synthase BioB n=1 Tax=Mycobacterium haemophilum TaxID=29311 RepID=UPI000654CA65|nr:biotin synthase BioB [Mycobacterium haemophilum]AKN16976.1 biotin synthase [Mycobacterium haemophilum DSM 44634]MCV7340394.1 biotin synthase BioB [Mycobacterium haemophilum DSM 44634]
MIDKIFDELLSAITTKALRGDPVDRDELLAVLASTDDDLLDVIAAAGRVRRMFFGRRVKLNYLVNMKSGMCPEDCGYCSQRLGSTAEILKYSWIDTDEAAQHARSAINAGAKRVCLVAAGRGPGDRDIERIAETVAAIKGSAPQVEVCVCLGLLKQGQADRLRQAGTDAYNHNLNTSAENYARICSTHTFSDRADTVAAAKAAGLSPCSGAIVGMGESDEDIVDVVLALRELRPDSVPVNFLIPFQGTPLGGHWELTPQRCLRILAMFRFAFPDVEVRVAGGREIHLRTLQPLALHLANSIFLGDYLTSQGQPGRADREMIADAGFVIEGFDQPTQSARPRDLVITRHRGAGTTAPANT